MIKRFVASSLLLLAVGCGSSKSADTSSPCGKAAAPLAGIVLLEVKHADDPKVLDTFQAELAGECKAQKLDETAKDALDCYDKNHDKMGYRLFKECPEQPGRALLDAVDAKH